MGEVWLVIKLSLHHFKHHEKFTVKTVMSCHTMVVEMGEGDSERGKETENTCFLFDLFY